MAKLTDAQRAKMIQSVLARIQAASKPNIPLSTWAIGARAELAELAIEHPAASTKIAVDFVYAVINQIETRFPADFDLCAMRQAELSNLLGQIGGSIEVVFGKLAQ